MTKLLRRLLGKPQRRAFIQGAGSVLDLGATGGRAQVMVFHARPAEQTVRDAWKHVMSSFVVETERK